MPEHTVCWFEYNTETNWFQVVLASTFSKALLLLTGKNIPIKPMPTTCLLYAPHGQSAWSSVFLSQIFQSINYFLILGQTEPTGSHY